MQDRIGVLAIKLTNIVRKRMIIMKKASVILKLASSSVGGGCAMVLMLEILYNMICGNFPILLGLVMSVILCVCIVLLVCVIIDSFQALTIIIDIEKKGIKVIDIVKKK